MADWVRFRHWDFSIEDVVAVERRNDGSVRVLLRGVPQITLSEGEAAVFLPRFNAFTKIEDLGVDFPGAAAADPAAGDIDPDAADYLRNQERLLPDDD